MLAYMYLMTDIPETCCAHEIGYLRFCVHCKSQLKESRVMYLCKRFPNLGEIIVGNLHIQI